MLICCKTQTQSLQEISGTLCASIEVPPFTDRCNTVNSQPNNEAERDKVVQCQTHASQSTVIYQCLARNNQMKIYIPIQIYIDIYICLFVCKEIFDHCFVRITPILLSTRGELMLLVVHRVTLFIIRTWVEVPKTIQSQVLIHKFGPPSEFVFQCLNIHMVWNASASWYTMCATVNLRPLYKCRLSLKLLFFHLYGNRGVLVLSQASLLRAVLRLLPHVLIS